MSDSADRRKTVAKAAALAITKGALSIPPGGGFVVELINAIERHADQRQRRVVALAVEALQTDVQELKRRIQEDEELADLWLRGLDAARRSHNDRKIRLFSSLLAGAVGADHSSRTTANAVLRVLDELDEDHILVLHVIEREATRPAPTSADKSEGTAGTTLSMLEVELPHLGSVMPILTNRLASLTLVKNVWEGTWRGVGGDVMLALTELGQEFVRVLRTDNL